MDDQLKSNLTSGEHWVRFIYMLLFGLFVYVALFVAAFVVVIQFVFALVTGAPNERLKRFGWEVAEYIHQVWSFLTYNSEEKAFPFEDWPSAPEASTAQQSTSQDSTSEDSTPEDSASEPLSTAQATPVAAEMPPEEAPEPQEELQEDAYEETQEIPTATEEVPPEPDPEADIQAETDAPLVEALDSESPEKETERAN